MAGRRRDPGTVIAKRRKRQTAARSATAGAKFEREGRVIQVQALIAEGVPEAEIVRWLVTEITDADVAAGKDRNLNLVAKPWKVSEPTARDYIRAAYRSWAEDDVRDSASKRHRQQARQRALLVYRRALADGDFARALTANDQVAKIDGAYDPVPPMPETDEDDLDLAEAVTLIDHAAATLELGRRRGVITAEQAASAIDVPPDPATPVIEGPPPPTPPVVVPTPGSN